MQRAILRSAPRATGSARYLTSRPNARRFLTTAPADRPRTWKGSGLRWGLAIGALYWYNTSPLFADELQSQTIPPPPQFSDSDLPTVEAIVQEKRKQAESKHQSQKQLEAVPPAPNEQEMVAVEADPSQAQSPEDLEQQADQQGAFNPETGEINWDCPCLGGMAHGPCGEEFKAAFSCFVYSAEEPKGMDCIDKFQHMQDCFRLHPEIYGSEIDDDTASPEADDEEAPAFALKENSNNETVAGFEEKSPIEDTLSEGLEEDATPKAKILPQAAQTPAKASSDVVSSTSSTVADPEATLASPTSDGKLDAGAKESVVPVDAFDATEANQSAGSTKTPKELHDEKVKEEK